MDYLSPLRISFDGPPAPGEGFWDWGMTDTGCFVTLSSNAGFPAVYGEFKFDGALNSRATLCEGTSCRCHRGTPGGEWPLNYYDWVNLDVFVCRDHPLWVSKLPLARTWGLLDGTGVRLTLFGN